MSRGTPTHLGRHVGAQLAAMDARRQLARLERAKRIAEKRAAALLATARLPGAQPRSDVAQAMRAGRSVRLEVAAAEGFTMRRAESAAMGALRRTGWRPLPDGLWINQRGQLTEIAPAVRAAFQRCRRE